MYVVKYGLDFYIWDFYIIKGITFVFSVVATALKNDFATKPAMWQATNSVQGKKPFMNPPTSK